VFSDPLSSSKLRLSASSPNGFEVDFVPAGSSVFPPTGRSLVGFARHSEHPLDVSPYCFSDPSLWLCRVNRQSTSRFSTPAVIHGVASWFISRRLGSPSEYDPKRLRQPLRAAAAFVRFRAPTAFSDMGTLARHACQHRPPSTFRRP
jgi:hypothetical protein